MSKTAADAKRSLMAMFLCFPTGTSDNFELRIQAYSMALSDLTADEICLVCARASRGEIGNPRFLPSAAELHAAARPVDATNDMPRKPSPEWRPHQDRLLLSSGTLIVTEGGKCTIYSREELKEFQYALPKPPLILNRDELIARGVAVLNRPLITEHEKGSTVLTRAIAKCVGSFGDE